MKYFISIILLLNSLFSQSEAKVVKTIDLPLSFNKNDFQPTKFNVNPTGFYFLDDENRQIAFLSNNGEVIYSGGYGIGNDAFIDPIDILSSRLRVYVIDRTENKLLEFDHKLNYLQTTEFENVYPEFSGIDDWGNIFLHTEQEQFILKSNPQLVGFDEFIDLSIWREINYCITDFYIAQDGSVGLLSDCSDFVYLFNRLGQIEGKYPTQLIDANLLIKIDDNWLVIGNKGEISTLKYGEIIELNLEQSILDIAQMDDLLYILFSDKIWVVDVSVE